MEKRLLFCHAAGFCAEVWRPVIVELASLARRAGKPPPACKPIDLPGHGTAAHEAPALPITSWDPFRDAVLRAAEGAPTIGVGHSLGASALVLAELARPGTFDGLLLYEPIIFPPWIPPGRHEKNPLSAGAARRRRSFASADEAREYFLGKPLFASFDARTLEGYTEGGLRPAADGALELCCDRDFEADIYRSDLSGIWARLPSVRCPVRVFCGGASRHMDAFGPGGSTTELYRQMAQQFGEGGAPFDVFDGLAHFGPLESPARFAACVEGVSAWPQSKL